MIKNETTLQMLSQGLAKNLEGFVVERAERARFDGDFNQLVDALKVGYSVSPDVYSQFAQIARQDRASGKTVTGTIPGFSGESSLNDPRPYLSNLLRDESIVAQGIDSYALGHKRGTVDFGKSQIGIVDVENSVLKNPTPGKDGLFNTLALMAHGTAQLTKLLEDGEKGIPVAYSSARDVVAKELSLLKEAVVVVRDWDTAWGTPSVDLAMKIVKQRKEIALNTLHRGEATTALIVGSLALASCMVPVDQNGIPTQFPEVVTENNPTEVVSVESTPEIEMTASAPVLESTGGEHVNVTNFGAYERPDVSDELADLVALREITTDSVLVVKLNAQIEEYEAGVEAINALRERVNKLPGAEQVKPEDIKLFNLAYEVEENGIAKIISAFEMATVKIDGKEQLAILSQIDGDEIVAVDSWVHSETIDGETEVFYLDKTTSDPIVIMRSIKEEPGFTEIFLADGTTLKVRMALDVSQSGGKMANFINQQMMPDLSEGKNGPELTINGQKYLLDTAKGEWVQATPDLTPAQKAEFEKKYGGVLKVTESGAVTDADGKVIEVFAYNPELVTLTWTHFSDLLGREITEPMSGIVKYEKGADGKAHPTGEIDFLGCSYKDRVCTPEYAIDPATGKEVKSAIKYSMFEILLRYLEDMKLMTEQDKLDAYDLTEDHYVRLRGASDRFSDGHRYVVHKDETGEYLWPLVSNGKSRWSNQIAVNGQGLIRGLPFRISREIEGGKTGWVVWEVNGVRREFFVDKFGIASYDLADSASDTYAIDPEWLPGEFETIPFD